MTVNLLKRKYLPNVHIQILMSILVEAFSNKDPNYLVLHILVNNLTDGAILNLTEQNTNILIHDRKFIPQYVLFDTDELISNKQYRWLACFGK